SSSRRRPGSIYQRPGSREVDLGLRRDDKIKRTRHHSRTMQFDLVIFDCDGVLIDSEMLSVRADIECLAEHGIELSAEEILERYTGISLAGMLTDLEARFGRTLPGFADRHRQCLERLFEDGLQPIPG